MEFINEDVETIIQSLVIYDTSNDGRINVDVPARVAETLNVGNETTKWIVEVVDLTWRVTGLTLDESPFPVLTSTNNFFIEREWVERVFKIGRNVGFGLILTSERNVEAFNVITPFGDTTIINNVGSSYSPQTKKADCLGYCTLTDFVFNERSSGGLNFETWHNTGPAMLTVNTSGGLVVNARLRLKLCAGFSAYYPSISDNGVVIKQETSGSFRPYYQLVDGTTTYNCNCTPLFITLKYKRELPLAMRYLL